MQIVKNKQRQYKSVYCELECAWCHDIFEYQQKKGPRRLYCSDRCRFSSRNSTEAVCCICHKHFIGKSKHILTCSGACGETLKIANGLERKQTKFATRPADKPAICIGCKKVKEPEHFYKKKSKSSVGILASRCTSCHYAHTRQYMDEVNSDEARKEKYLERRRDWRKKKYRNDTSYNIMNKMRSSTRHLAEKKISTSRLLGYSAKQLRDHLHSLFTEGMNWERFLCGEIHIDHIIPSSVFDQTDHVEVKDCWSLDNLRPMWAQDNMSKSNKACAHEACPVLWMKYGHRVKTVIENPKWQ